MKNILIILFLIIVSGCSTQVEKKSYEFTNSQAVRAIIGEASGEGYGGMLAVACALRNRGTLKGVYGYNSPHIYREPEWVWEMASKVWDESAKFDITGGATNWHNLDREGENYWTKSMQVTYRVGQHVFYKKGTK